MLSPSRARILDRLLPHPTFGHLQQLATVGRVGHGWCAPSNSKHAPAQDCLFLLGQPSDRAPDENGRLLSTDEHTTRSRTRRPRSSALPYIPRYSHLYSTHRHSTIFTTTLPPASHVPFQPPTITTTTYKTTKRHMACSRFHPSTGGSPLSITHNFHLRSQRRHTNSQTDQIHSFFQDATSHFSDPSRTANFTATPIAATKGQIPIVYGVISLPKFKFTIQHSTLQFNIQLLQFNIQFCNSTFKSQHFDIQVHDSTF